MQVCVSVKCLAGEWQLCHKAYYLKGRTVNENEEEHIEIQRNERTTKAKQSKEPLALIECKCGEVVPTAALQAVQQSQPLSHLPSAAAYTHTYTHCDKPQSCLKPLVIANRSIGAVVVGIIVLSSAQLCRLCCGLCADGECDKVV